MKSCAFGKIKMVDGRKVTVTGECHTPFVIDTVHQPDALRTHRPCNSIERVIPDAQDIER